MSHRSYYLVLVTEGFVVSLDSYTDCGVVLLTKGWL